MTDTSHQRRDAFRCEQLGIRTRIIKPCTPADVHGALISALSAPQQEAYMLEAFDVDGALERERPPGSRLHVMLAEDNPVNQAVAVKMLERAGHKVTLANDGREAVELFERERFDVILMDVQMPILGGFEATRAIRAREQRRSWAYADSWASTPIVALTAHAMAGDRERCLEAGMDDYLTKPLRADKLNALLDRVERGEFDPMRSGAMGRETEGVATDGAAAQYVELHRTLETLGGDTQVLCRMIDLFLRDFDAHKRELRSAAAAADAERFTGRAHHARNGAGISRCRGCRGARAAGGCGAAESLGRGQCGPARSPAPTRLHRGGAGWRLQYPESRGRRCLTSRCGGRAYQAIMLPLKQGGMGEQPVPLCMSGTPIAVRRA